MGSLDNLDDEKKMKEFNLSNKRRTGGLLWTYKEENVKEFIKRLKKAECDCTCCKLWLLKIYKLAGDKLI